jgi:hypothetical protein
VGQDRSHQQSATFEVQLGSGQKYYGILGLARDGSVVVGADTLALPRS